eukprot:6193540-Pleurochrysis_carterae.AAC.4
MPHGCHYQSVARVLALGCNYGAVSPNTSGVVALGLVEKCRGRVSPPPPSRPPPAPPASTASSQPAPSPAAWARAWAWASSSSRVSAAGVRGPPASAAWAHPLPPSPPPPPSCPPPPPPASTASSQPVPWPSAWARHPPLTSKPM